jgi:hypothetical protein
VKKEAEIENSLSVQVTSLPGVFCRAFLLYVLRYPALRISPVCSTVFLLPPFVQP